MMLRWSVFPGTVGIIAPLVLSPLLCFLYHSLYFGLWEPAGHCTSDSTPSSMKTREIRLSSVGVHVWVWVLVRWCWLEEEVGVILRQKIIIPIFFLSRVNKTVKQHMMRHLIPFLISITCCFVLPHMFFLSLFVHCDLVDLSLFSSFFIGL